MIDSKTLRVSIVIPVYNEATQLAACLQAIAAQNVTPHQVIVVNNNSTDGTAAVAERYDFVTVLYEAKQGVIHARTTGFDAATGDIIARIDADSIVPTDWIYQIQQVFTERPELDAVSGAAQYYNVACAPLFNAIDLFFRRRLERQLKGNVYLWGANMAMRRSAWRATRPALCHKGGLHEDYDIAIHLQEHGGHVAFDERLKAQVSSRRIDVGYLDFMRYVLVSPDTYAQHGIRERYHMYEVAAVCAIGYWPARLLHRGYDADSDSFSLLRALTYRAPIPVRVDPTANVA
jgi:cellulose synthase/poly-beta-1,6-N-acetylglucosamine synthase-like glycosyltransferase